MNEINTSVTVSVTKSDLEDLIVARKDQYYIELAESNDELTGRSEKRKPLAMDLNMILLMLRAYLMGDGDISQNAQFLLSGLLKLVLNMKQKQDNSDDAVENNAAGLKEKGNDFSGLEKNIEDLLDEVNATELEKEEKATGKKEELQELDLDSLEDILTTLFQAIEESQTGQQHLKDSIERNENGDFVVQFAGMPDSSITVRQEDVKKNEKLSLEASTIIQALIQSAS